MDSLMDNELGMKVITTSISMREYNRFVCILVTLNSFHRGQWTLLYSGYSVHINMRMTIFTKISKTVGHLENM